MERNQKIKNMLEALGYTCDANIRFSLRRFEKVDRIHSNVKGKDEEQLNEMFKLFHTRFGIKIAGNTFPVSTGEISVKKFMDFLGEYDEKFGLDWCEIEFKELSIKPAYI